jgi:hypothetical protein
MRLTMQALGGVAVAATIAGCGSSSKTTPTTAASPSAAVSPSAPSVSADQRGVLRTVDALESASRRGDGKTICRELFTSALVRSIQTAAKRRCATEVKRHLFSPNAQISVQRGVQVKGKRATAVVREQNGNFSTLVLREQRGRWRINSVVPRARQ